MAIRGVQVVSIPVSDQERAKTFYVETLGFEAQRDATFPQDGQQMRWIEVTPKGGATTFTLVTWFPQMPAGTLQGVVLTSDDIEGDYAALKARGLTFDGEIQQAPWGTFATFSDPDGNGFVLQQNS